MARTANEIANLFFEDIKDNEPLVTDCGSFGLMRTWKRNLTRKQTDWLVDIWQRENPKGRGRYRSYSGYQRTDAQGFIPDMESSGWTLAIMPSGSGVLTVTQRTDRLCAECGQPTTNPQCCDDCTERLLKMAKEAREVANYAK